MSDITSNTPNRLSYTRSVLFTPGTDERKLMRALTSGADLVVADFEDAIPDDDQMKEAARLATCAAFVDSPTTAALAVRINGYGTRHFAADIVAVDQLDLDAIVLPKATPDAVESLGPVGPPVIAIIETAVGLRLAYEVASSPRVAVLALGAADLGAELWLDPHPDGQELLYARSKLVADSAAAAIRPPIDSVQLDVADQDVLAAEAALGRRIGLRGKLCIHPAQIAVVNEAFAPTRMETQWASEVVAAHDAAALAGRGATLVRGALVDEAIVRRARMILTAVDVRGEESTWGGITPASTHSVKGG